MPSAMFLWLITQLQMTRLNYLVYPKGYLINRLAFRTNRIIQSPLTLHCNQWALEAFLERYVFLIGSRFPWKVNAKSTRDQVLIWSSVHVHFTPHGGYELNKLTWLPKCGCMAQLGEHRTSIAEVTGSNPVEALIFFQVSSFQWGSPIPLLKTPSRKSN